MIRSHVVRLKALSLVAVVAATVAVASCSEDIQGGTSCPVLCPQGSPPLKDTILDDAVTFDTSVATFPQLGFERNLVLAKRGDTLDTRVITRYDTVPAKYAAAGQDSNIVRIDSAFITARRPAADSLVTFKDSASVEVYDVTDAVNDTSTASLLAEFKTSNRIGVRKYGPGDKPDTLRVWLDTSRVRQRILVTKRLRIALRLVTTGSEQIRISSAEAGNGIRLTIRASPDTTVAALNIDPTSETPPDAAFLTPALSDFTIAAVTAPPSSILRVGGFPGRRVLMRFRLPPLIVDSSAVIRATLFLTQSPTGPSGGDTVRLHVVPIIASQYLTDLHAQLEFAGVASLFAVDSVLLSPKDSAKRSLEIVGMIRSWRNQDTIRTPRALGLVIATEGAQPTAINFFSKEAPAAVRPRLRLTYVAKLNTGRP